MVRLTYLQVLILFLSTTSYAQESIDLFTISLRYGSPSPYLTQYTGKATETGALVNLTAPIPLNVSKTAIWYNSLVYTQAGIKNSEVMPSEIANPISLHGFILRTGYIRNFANGTGFQILLAPRFMTDFENVSSKNWQLGGIAMYEKRYSENLRIRYGVLYNQELFGPIITPLLDIYWVISDRWSIVGTLPISVKVNYRVSDNTIIGFSHFGLTTTYRLGNLAYIDDYIERTSIDLSLFARQRISGNIHLEGRFGHTLNRRYAQYSEDQKLDLRLMIVDFGDNRVQKNGEIQNGFIGSLRIVYNLPIPD